MTPGSPTLTGASYDDGDILVTGSEDLVLVDGSSSPWTVTFDGVAQPIGGISQAGNSIFLTTTQGGATEIRLSYSGGAYVIGAVSGLPLAPVEDFPVAIL